MSLSDRHRTSFGHAFASTSSSYSVALAYIYGGRPYFFRAPRSTYRLPVGVKRSTTAIKYCQGRSTELGGARVSAGIHEKGG